jgi:uncharacterized membrane protein YgdD (TMEM256/DUF423 family)
MATALPLAGVFGAIGVMAGAFAAHGLAPLKGERAAQLWQSASHYQIMHALALIGVVLGWERAMAVGRYGQARWLSMAACGFAAGGFLFPGALYGLGWFGPSVLGLLAPLGGLAWITAWLSLAWAGLSSSVE